MSKLPHNPSSKKAAAYIRYSSNMQDDSFSLEAQERQIRRRAEQDGYAIVNIFSDQAQTAYRKKYRPGVIDLLDAAEQNQFSVLYVHKVDRLARNLEWMIDIVKKLKEYGVILKAVEQDFDLETPGGKLFFHMLASLGEFYSDNLSQETHKGKYERVMQGYHNGLLPFGYESKLDESNRKVGQLIPGLQPVIAALFTRFATGSYSDQQMADWLSDQGYRRRDGRLFTKDSLRDMLQNIYYAGQVRYRGDKERFKGKNYRRMDGEIVAGKHVAAIEMALFKSCQTVRAERRSTISTRQKTRHSYFVNGIITCVHCGRKMRAQSAKYGSNYREASRLTGHPACSVLKQSVRSAIIDAQIGTIIQRLRLPDNWEAAVKALIEKNPDVIDPERESARIRKALRDLREMKKRGLYDEDVHVFWKDVEALQEELAKLKTIEKPAVNQAATTMLDIQAAWQQATRIEQEELVKMLFKEVGCDIDQERIVWIQPKPVFEALFQLMDAFRPDKNGKWIIPAQMLDGDE